MNRVQRVIDELNNNPELLDDEEIKRIVTGFEILALRTEQRIMSMGKISPSLISQIINESNKEVAEV